MRYLWSYQLDVHIMDVAMAGREAFEKPGTKSDLRIRGLPLRIGKR